ncbi:MAG: MOSC domain-containing protein [Hyphomicrobiaceae bacterium]|nr:MOSC domain-containing protein [Hyphomicrobiaceae bacterium]
MTDDITVTGLYRYPVKGLSPQALPRVRLEQGETMPFDRAWAVENGPGRFDQNAPRHLPKAAFLMLMRDERLATLQTSFDEATQTLTIARGGKPVSRGDLATKTGRSIIEQFLAAYMKDSLRGPPRIVSAPGHSFTDIAEQGVHLINLATLADLERVMGRKLNPLRFRPNIVISGAAPWAEFGWLGQELRIGSGGVRLEITDRVGRCAATNVDPETGARDADIPARLERQWGHRDFGVYAKVTARGVLTCGDAVSTSAARAPA